MQASTTKTCAAPRGSSRPWQASIARADLDRPEQIGPLFSAFRTIYIYPKKLPDHLISRRFSVLIRMLIRLITQPSIKAEP
jgi:hypothetical protein